MIPDVGNRTVTVKLENSSAVPPKYFTTEVVGWRQLDHEDNRLLMPMVWNQWLLIAMPFGAWIEAVTRRHCDDTDVAWSVTYKGLDTKTINVRVEEGYR